MLETTHPPATAILAASTVVGLFPKAAMSALRSLGRAATVKGRALLVTNHVGRNFMPANGAFPVHPLGWDPTLRRRISAKLSGKHFHKLSGFVVGAASATGKLSDQRAQNDVIGMEAA